MAGSCFTRILTSDILGEWKNMPKEAVGGEHWIPSSINWYQGRGVNNGLPDTTLEKEVKTC